jgi:ATP-dependent DNA helicase RecQ
MEGGTEIARQVIECVQALRLPFGAGYVADVLAGAKLEKIRARRHDRLPQYGVLAKLGRAEIQRIVLQLVDLDFLDRSPGDRPVLTLTESGFCLLKGDVEVRLRAAEPLAASAPRPGDEWEGVDRGLFDALRALRREIAEERSVAAFVIFSDTTLRDLARQRPVTVAALLNIKGVGERKQTDFGQRFIDVIAAYCREHRLASQSQAKSLPSAAPESSRNKAFRMFEEGRALDEVAAATGRSRGTITQYLEEYVDERRPESVAPWVPAALYDRIRTVAVRLHSHLLKPVFEALNEEVAYDDIRIVMKHAGLR